MWLSPDIMRAMLFLTLLGMALLAGIYLRTRRLSPSAYLGYGLVILLLPILGPFWVILSRPGAAHPRLSARERRLRRERSPFFKE